MKDVDEAKVFAFIRSLKGISSSEKEKCFAIFYENFYESFLEQCYDNAIKEDEAFRVNQLLAQAGFAWAYSEIGEALLYGRGCNKDINAAISWIDKALDAKMYVAEEVGDCFRQGNNGLPLDYTRAWKIYRSDAENHRFDFSYGCDGEDRNSAVNEWWEYVANQAKLTLSICLWMKDCYKEDAAKRYQWLKKGLVLCKEKRRILDEESFDTVAELFVQIFAEKCDEVTGDAVKLVSDILNSANDSDLLGYDCEIKRLLDAFFDVHGHNEQKQLAWHMIDEKCRMAETKMFVRWAGVHRFDEAESKEGICVLCHRKTMCAPILFPSDKSGRPDCLFFCRDCYGDVFYDNDCGDNDLHQSKRRNMFNVISPNGIDDGFSLD